MVYKILTLAALIGLIAGCARREMRLLPENRPASYVSADGRWEGATIDTLIDHYPHMKMMDGKITLNDRCPVRRVPLNLRLPTLYVNEQPIGFC
jgi:hypothetical protein